MKSMAYMTPGIDATRSSITKLLQNDNLPAQYKRSFTGFGAQKSIYRPGFRDQVARLSDLFSAPATAPQPLKAQSAPSGLSGMLQGLDPIQARSALATQAIGGSGLAGDDQKYYFDLLRQGLEGGDQMITPVEREYLSRQGVAGNDPVAVLNYLRGL